MNRRNILQALAATPVLALLSTRDEPSCDSRSKGKAASFALPYGYSSRTTGLRILVQSGDEKIWTSPQYLEEDLEFLLTDGPVSVNIVLFSDGLDASRPQIRSKVLVGKNVLKPSATKAILRVVRDAESTLKLRADKHPDAKPIGFGEYQYDYCGPGSYSIFTCQEPDSVTYERAIRGNLPDKTVAWSTLFENGGWSRHGSYSLIPKESA